MALENQIQQEKKWAFDFPVSEAKPLRSEHPIDKQEAYHVMETELNEKIIAITLEIRKKYPELLTHLNEMPISAPDQEHPDMSYNVLRGYYDSLCTLVETYKVNYPKSRLF